MTKSSSWRGEGLGDSLCFPLEGRGDRKECECAVKRLGAGDPLAVMDEEDDDDEEEEEEVEVEVEGCLPNGGPPNHVPGLLIAFVRGLGGTIVDSSISRCIMMANQYG